MRPLAELPVDGVRGIFADLDDTLTWHGALVPAAYAALCDAVAAGLRVIIATGRPGGWAEVLAALWPVAAVVAENGGYAVLRDGRLRYWDGAEARAEQRARLDALVADAAARLPFARLADDAALRRVDVAFDVRERARLSDEQIAALADLVRGHGARVLVSSIHLHAFYGTHDKPGMLARLAHELWSEPPEETARRYVFVGDSPNDQAAFGWFERSVGVANVARFRARLAPPPAYVAAEEGGAGFAAVVARVLSPPR